MVTCKTYRSPRKLCAIWAIMYAEGDYTPFQSWISNWWYFVTYHLKGTRRQYQPRFLLFMDGGKQCIIPIAVNDKQKRVLDFSVGGPIDYYDVLCTTRDVEFVKECLGEMRKLYKGYEIRLTNINESSLLINALQEEAIVEEEKCAKIVFASNKYENYYQSISKHQRQNIRTGYNKLGREGMVWRIEKYDAKKTMPHGVRSKCLKMYEDRIRMKTRKSNGWRQRVVEWKNRQINIVNILAQRWDRMASFVMFLNDEPVAYMFGVYSEKQDKFYVPRLSCNNQYLCYDTGILMLNESIKILLKEGVRMIDLTRGDEPYKLAMGGIVHKNYGFRL